MAYGVHPDQVADVWLPSAVRRADAIRRPTVGTGTERTPLVLFLHGGFWRHEWDRAHTGPLSAALAGLGYAVATVEYRRTGASDGGWPGTFEDVSTAVRTVPELVASSAGVNPARVVVAGHSAGGHLALWAAADLAREGRAPIGVVALAPVADLRAAYQLDLDGGAVTALLGGGPDVAPDHYALADPMSLVPLGARLLLVHGARDLLVPPELSHRFAAAARAAGDDVGLIELPDADHYDMIDPESPAWPAVVQAFHAVEQP